MLITSVWQEKSRDKRVVASSKFRERSHLKGVSQIRIKKDIYCPLLRVTCTDGHSAHAVI